MTFFQNFLYFWIFSKRVCKKIFFNERCPKSAVRGGKTKLFNFFFIGASAKKCWVRLQIFRYGLPEDFLSKGQKGQWLQTLSLPLSVNRWFIEADFAAKNNCGEYDLTIIFFLWMFSWFLCMPDGLDCWNRIC